MINFRISFFIYIVIISVLLLQSCSSGKKFCKQDKIFISLFERVPTGVDQLQKREFYCDIDSLKNDSVFIIQHYSKDVLYKGYEVEGFKSGIWSGFFSEKNIINVVYSGESEDQIMYFELLNLDGEKIEMKSVNFD